MTHANMTPYRCPVCDGRGQVAPSFYAPPLQGVTTSAGPRMEPCRACDNGVVWAMEIVTNVIEIRQDGNSDDLTMPTTWRN